MSSLKKNPLPRQSAEGMVDGEPRLLYGHITVLPVGVVVTIIGIVDIAIPVVELPGTRTSRCGRGRARGRRL